MQPRSSTATEPSFAGDLYVRTSATTITSKHASPQRVTLRNLVYRFLIDSGREPSRLRTFSILYQSVISAVVIALVCLSPYYELQEVGTPQLEPYWVKITEFAVGVIWIIEHMLRFWSCVEGDTPRNWQENFERSYPRCWYALQPLMFVDTLGLLGMFGDLTLSTSQMRGVSILRLMRLLALFHVEEELIYLNPALTAFSDSKKELVTIFGLANCVGVVAAIVVYYLEEPLNPSFNSMYSSLWWAYTCMTTVGYGDIIPETFCGRIMGTLVAFFGTGLIGAFGAQLYQCLEDMMEEEDDRVGREIMALVTSERSLAHSHEAELWVLRQQLNRIDERVERRLVELKETWVQTEQKVVELQSQVEAWVGLLHRLAWVLQLRGGVDSHEEAATHSLK